MVQELIIPAITQTSAAMALGEKFRLSNLFVEIISFMRIVFIDYKDQTIAIHQGDRFNLRQ